MRKHGLWLLRVTEALGTIRLRETVVRPALADMQHECGGAGSEAGRKWVVSRGYWSIFAGSLFYAALQPARYLREDWSSLSAPGPRLLRQVWPPAAVAAALFLGIGVSTWPNEKRLGLDVIALLLPSLLLSIAPTALAVGVGWALARDRSGSRAVVAVGLLLAVFSSAFQAMLSTARTTTSASAGTVFVELSPPPPHAQETGPQHQCRQYAACKGRPKCRA